MVPSSVAAQDTRNAELAASDAQLNKVYGALIRQLGKEDQAALRTSQRAWLSFRDLDCKFGWGDKRDCLIARTDERVEQLGNSLYWMPNGKQIDLSNVK
jgi:uncharacterized protein YecT (DUF1311 family)